MLKSRSANKGFILVDVLLGVIIIAVALIAIGGLYYQSGRANIFADNRTVAFNWAQNYIEFLKTDATWRGAAGGAAPNDAAPRATFNAAPPRPGFAIQSSVPLANVSAVIQNLPATTMNRQVLTTAVSDHLIDVTVTVSWQENGQAMPPISLRTYIERD